MSSGFRLLAARWPPGASMQQFLTDALVDDHAFVKTAVRIIASEFESELKVRRAVEAIGHGETSRGRIESRAGASGNTLDGALRVLTDTKQLVDRRLLRQLVTQRL